MKPILVVWDPKADTVRKYVDGRLTAEWAGFKDHDVDMGEVIRQARGATGDNHGIPSTAA